MNVWFGCPATGLLSGTIVVPIWHVTRPEVAMYRVGHVPKRLCPETVMSRSGYVPKRLCPEVTMSRNGYVPKLLCPETVMSRNVRRPAGFTSFSSAWSLEWLEFRPGAKIINVFRAWIGAQLTICAQK